MTHYEEEIIEPIDEYIEYLEDYEFNNRIYEYQLIEEMEKSGKGVRNINLGDEEWQY